MADQPPHPPQQAKAPPRRVQPSGIKPEKAKEPPLELAKHGMQGS